MVEISPTDEALLIRAIRRGEVALFLGAGSSATSHSSRGEPVIQGGSLAAKLAELSGIPYHNEPLSSVVSALVPGRISRAQFERILQDEFTRCTPSPEMGDLLNFCWARLYTWNLDDVIGNCRGGIQRIKSFNGMVDQVTPNSDISFLQVVHLHGDAWKLDSGYIFSERQYNDAILKGHAWYRQATADYAEKIPVFVGSKLKEPILSLELDRARPEGVGELGVAFLVSPDDFTPLQLTEFGSRGIVVIKATLKQFTDWLKAKVAIGGWNPKDVLNERGELGRKLLGNVGISTSDLSIIQHVRLIFDGDREVKIKTIPADEVPDYARRYLEGAPPSWRIVREEIPVSLAQNRALSDQLLEAFQSTNRLFVVYGQSGSGKTTALMSVALKLAQISLKCPIYEIGGDVPSLRQAIGLLARFYPDRKIIVYFGESFIFGDTFAEDLQSVDAGRILFIGDARTREWKNHIKRRLEGVGYRSFEYERFDSEDYDALADAIVQYVPAPSFHKLTKEQRIKKFAESRSQLLIALKEATQSVQFRDVIRKEYEGLPSDDVKQLFLICGIGTLARTGISVGMAREVFDRHKSKIPFSEAISDLSGIVSDDRNGRLVARHEVYVRHIVENVASLELVEIALTGILAAFTKYEAPVIKNVSRQDGVLFKFALNHDFIRDLFQRKGDLSAPKRIYSKFEVEFQRDGHYWLQYGQYLSSAGEIEDALVVLERSIQAYPENEFAAHALADVQLKVAARAPEWNSSVAELVGAAVIALEALHKDRSDSTDQYPIQTLAERHIEALVKHGRIDEAKLSARRYFNEIEKFKAEARSDSLERTRLHLLHFVTTGSVYEVNNNRTRGGEITVPARKRGGKKDRSLPDKIR